MSSACSDMAAFFFKLPRNCFEYNKFLEGRPNNPALCAWMGLYMKERRRQM